MQCYVKDQRSDGRACEQSMTELLMLPTGEKITLASPIGRQRVKDEYLCEWKTAKFGPLRGRNPSCDFHEIWHTWLRLRDQQACQIWFGSDKKWRPHRNVKYTRGVTYFRVFKFYFFLGHAVWKKSAGRFWRLMAQTARLGIRKCLLGVRRTKIHILWVSGPQNPQTFPRYREIPANTHVSNNF